MLKKLKFLPLFLLLIFASCNNFFENPVENSVGNPSETGPQNSQTKYVSVTGSLGIDGAIPAEFMQMYQRQAEPVSSQAEPLPCHADLEACHAELVSASLNETPKQVRGDSDTSRTAFPSIPSTGLTYTVTAVNTASGSTEAYAATVTTSESGTNYVVAIPAPVPTSETPNPIKSFKITASVKQGDNQLFYGESDSFDISFSSPVAGEAVNVSVHAKQTVNYLPAGTGNARLEVGISGSGVTKGKLSIDNAAASDFDAESNKIVFTSSGLNSGVHTAKFDFINDDNIVLYSFTEVINIFDNMTTNTWVQNGNEPWFVTTTDAGGNKSTTCRITAAMVAGYALKDIYVDSTRTTTDPSASTYTTQSGTFINPVTSFDTALALLHDASLDYTIYIKGTLEGQTHGVLSITDELSSTAGDTKAYHAHSLTICGATGVSESGIPQDVINAKGFGIALSITTQVPVTIKNLKIQRGYSEDSGGGIYSTGDLTLDSGTLITQNTAKYYGGGVANDGGKLTIKSGAVISSNEVSYAKKGTDDCGGGGVYNRNGTLIMSGGTIKSNTAEGCGGGIFNIIDDGEKLCVAYIYGDAVIGGDTADDGNKALGTSSSGGGIYNKGGLVYLGCTDYLKIGGMDTIQYYFPDPSKNVPWTGKMSHNSAGLLGGGIVNYPGPSGVGMKGYGMIHIQSGKICSNTASGGGGVMIQNGSLFYLNGGTIGGDNSSEGNSATSQGGGIYSLGKFFINGGTVSYNTAAAGGGIYDSMGIDMYGGTVKNNTATSYGGGIYMESRSLTLSGNAYIPAGSDGSNDVYLTLGSDPTNNPTSKVLITASITPPEECTDGIVAKITPSDYSDENKILVLSESATTEIEDEFSKFDIKQPDETSHYLINYLGKLQSKYGSKAGPTAVYDIVFNDGSAEAYSSSLVLSKKQKDNAIAVIYVIETGLNDAGQSGTRMLGVGLVQKRLTWCTTSAKAYNEHISGIAYNADNNGSTNLSQIATFLGTNNDTGLGTSTKSAEEAADLYPAYYFGINYKDQSRSHNDDMYYSNVAGTAFETGWYLPAYWELEILVSRTPALTAQINTIMELIHGMPFTKNFVDGELYGWWTSSMRNEEDYKTNAMYLVYNGDSVIGSYTGKERGFITCAVRQFN